MTDTLEVVVKTLIETQVIKALNEAPEAIDKLVKAALAKPVDQHGDSKGFHANTPYLEWLVGEEIRRAARSAVQKVVQEHAATIEAHVRTNLSSEAIASAITQAVLGAAAQDWQINVAFAKRER